MKMRIVSYGRTYQLNVALIGIEASSTTNVYKLLPALEMLTKSSTNRVKVMEDSAAVCCDCCDCCEMVDNGKTFCSCISPYPCHWSGGGPRDLLPPSRSFSYLHFY